MKKSIIFLLFIFVSIIICIGIVAFKFFLVEKNDDQEKTVYVIKTKNGFQLINNGKNFYIKGASGVSHFRELADTGGNTIRLYDTLNLQSNLDTAQKYGISVIVDIPIPSFHYANYMNKVENNVTKKRLKDLVNKFKEHPALLLWNLGNELRYPKVQWKDFIRMSKSKKQFIHHLNELIEIIYFEDKNHPISTATFNVNFIQFASIKLISPGFDLLSYNIFGDTKNLNEKLKQFAKIFGESPYYISELGPDGWWLLESRYTSWWAPIEQTSTKKAEQVNERYKLIENNYVNCLGTLIFYWGDKYECTGTWFSLFKDEYKSEILMEIEHLWNNTQSKPMLLGLDYMLVDGKGAADNLIFTPNELKQTELKLNTSSFDSMRIQWEVYPDIWYQGWFVRQYTYKRLKPPTPLDCLLKAENNKATFITPEKEGPYRIFAYVYHKNGYFASTNTPFYILNTK